jgi:TonB family protein
MSKSNTRQGGETAAAVDRRLGARLPIPSIAYIDLGKNNGGIILNLGEGGLAVNSVAPLDPDSPARMQFQLPGSSDRLAARGEITWISESRKEAGLHFVDLSKDVRGRITGWISSQEKSSAETAAAFAEKVRQAGPPSARSDTSLRTEFAGKSERTQKEVQNSPATEVDSRSLQKREFVASRPAEPPAERAREPSDRRAYVRRPVPSLAYIDLGDNNGGIIVNLSEGGLAVTSHAPMHADSLAQMQFQLPGSSGWLKVGGKITWTSQSRREVGLRFAEPSGDVRHQIASWISSETNRFQFGSEGAGSREKAWRRLEMPTISMTLPVEGSMLGGHEAPTSFDRTRAPGLGVAPQGPRRRLLLPRQAWVALALIVVLGAFLAGWFSPVPDSLSKILARFEKTRSETSEAARDVESAPAGSFGNVPGPSAENASPPANRHTEPAATSPRDFMDQPLGRRRDGSGKGLVPPGEAGGVANLPERRREPVRSTAASGLDSPILPAGPGSVAAQPPERGAPASPILNQPSGGSGTAAPASLLAPQPKEGPEAMKPSFSVSFDPYPSIRVPAGLTLEKAQHGTRLEIGQLLSRVDPVYPEEAKKQGVEGTVKLHVILGPDGSVENLQTISGPPLLIPAAENAVRQWRYTESSIGGQPVEAEEDIAITFRLVGPAAHTN